MKLTEVTLFLLFCYFCILTNALHLKDNNDELSKNLGDTNLFLKDSHNYFVTKAGNQVWAGALTLAWQSLKDNIIKEQIQVESSNSIVQKIVDNFNKCPFKRQDLSQSDYYIKSGFGQQTVDKINKQVKQKFPQKSFSDISMKLQDKDIISYAYLFKAFEYPTQFEKLPNFKFKNQTVDGFGASTSEHRSQVKPVYYENQNEFMVKVQTKKQKQGVYYVRTGAKQTLVQDIIKQVNKWQKYPSDSLSRHDYFQMPVVNLDYFRDVSQLKNVYIRNNDFKEYKFSSVYEALKLKIDQTGVRVQNQGVISVVATSAAIEPVKNRYFYLNDTFWIVLKQQGKHPYLVIKINQPKQQAKL